MRALGIDIGSRSIKAALLEDGELSAFTKVDTSFDPLERCRRLLEEMSADGVIATGYGRHLLEVHSDIKTITEIKAFARGARAMFPSCRTIIDIGGQDTKVISLDGSGNVKKFEMNDRCAAGTGKFVEIMARALGYCIEDFGSVPLMQTTQMQINSMCTVFAESEVISLITKGARREDIALALHRSVANRVLSMVRRVAVEDEVVFAGGCARNNLLKSLLEAGAGKKIKVAENPEITGALGAALFALQR
ncbi:MAG: acyl-CoA dehydratase activase [Nitrospiraceae bacterium]|nr:acyl-CoA dehydratase activase [Nitrospiraceae bacterium]